MLCANTIEGLVHWAVQSRADMPGSSDSEGTQPLHSRLHALHSCPQTSCLQLQILSTLLRQQSSAGSGQTGSEGAQKDAGSAGSGVLYDSHLQAILGLLQ